MKHLFVPYEIARTLRTKGFDEICMAHYEIGIEYDDDLKELGDMCRNSDDWIEDQNGLACTAPLYQQVVDWLRDIKGFHIYIIDTYENWKPTGYQATISKPEEGTFEQPIYPNYYEALTEAINHALTLIP